MRSGHCRMGPSSARSKPKATVGERKPSSFRWVTASPAIWSAAAGAPFSQLVGSPPGRRLGRGEFVGKTVGPVEKANQFGGPGLGCGAVGEHLVEAVTVLATQVAEAGQLDFDRLQPSRVMVEVSAGPADLPAEFVDQADQLLGLDGDALEFRVVANQTA